MVSTNISPSTNKLPKVAGMVVTYAGDLVDLKWLSLVDSTLNSGNPCFFKTVAGAAADNTHTGGMQATSGKVVAIPQGTAGTLLDATKTYSVCYAENDGTATDGTWRDSYVRLQVSMLEYVSSHSVSHRTSGQLAMVANLQLTYSGVLDNNKWISLVDSTLNSNDPCASGPVAAAGADTGHSGPVQAGSTDKITTVDTTGMSTSLVFAVCYTDATTGNAAAAWADAGIRLTVSKIVTLSYGNPARTMTSANKAAAVNRLPQAANMVLTYVGDLTVYKWLSLVDSTLNSNNPCVLGTVAAAAMDTTHSGPIRATENTKVVTVPQAVLLSEAKTYAVCYAETSGTTTDSTWTDSYVRLEMSQISSIQGTAFSLHTSGSIPLMATDMSTISSLVVTSVKSTYVGSLVSNKWVSLVDSTLNPITLANTASPFPCADGTIAAAASDATHSGPKQAGGSDKIVSFDTTILSTAKTFAVCYNSASGATTDTWKDSGIRVIVSKISSIKYGKASTSFPVRHFTNRQSPSNVIPQVLT
jgi:hypothetical protein